MKSVTHKSVNLGMESDSHFIFGVKKTTDPRVMGVFQLKTDADIDCVVAVFELDSESNTEKYVSAFIGSLATLVSKHEDDKAAAETVLAFYLKLGLSYSNIKDFFTAQNNFWAVSLEKNRIVDFMFPNNGEIKISEKLTVKRGKVSQ